MIQVGLTGNVASGKSTVARLWSEAGVPVVSADQLAREVVEPGTPGLDDVAEAFGPDVLTPEGHLDRGALGRIVFADPDARKRLEGLLHPRIARLRDRWVEARRAEGAALVVSEIPLLFEVGLEASVDQVVVVSAPEEERVRRMVAHRDMTAPEARKVMAAQSDPPRGAVHHWIENDGTPLQLEIRAQAVLDRLRKAAGLPARTLRLDLHLHTAGSWDSRSDPRRVLERARARGIDRIAITDHNRLQVALEMAREHPDAIIPGEEVKTGEGVDVIGWYLSEEIAKGTLAAETCRQIRAQGGLVYLPHPFAPGKGGSGRLAETLAPQLDAVEGFNARLRSTARNRRAQAFAAAHDLPMGAGSDAHTVGEVGPTTVEVPNHPNRPEALLEALRHGTIRGRDAPLFVFVASNCAKLLNRIDRH